MYIVTKIIHYQNCRLLEYINQNYLYERRMGRMGQIDKTTRAVITHDSCVICYTTGIYADLQRSDLQCNDLQGYARSNGVLIARNDLARRRGCRLSAYRVRRR